MAKILQTLVLSWLIAAGSASAQFFNDFDESPHDYWTAKMRDPMTRLLDRLAAGEAEPLDKLAGRELLTRLLEELEIPVESQVMVFSRTSLQRAAVARDNPRAIYFNEETYLSYIPGARIEIASSDPERGAVFYFQRALDQPRGKLFTRDKVCIQCHAGSATNFLPGLLGRSVYPDARGRSLKSVDAFERVGHEAQLSDRWGGWYVSGGHGDLRHMGNALATRGADGVEIDRAKLAGLQKLDQFFEQGKYPLGTSDIVALLVLDHQVSMHYMLMEAHYMVRQALADAGWDSAGVPEELPEAFAKDLAKITERVTRYLLFEKEAPLGGREIDAFPGFREAFLSGRRVDAERRSLKDFNLRGRLFEHRCSFMIYSESFTALPPVLKNSIYLRLAEVLSAKEPVAGYTHLPPEERAAILSILRATMPEFARIAA